jgi:hypothetical protein
VRIFLSYRRRDVGGYAGRLVDALVQRLGAENVFHDVSTIGLGQDFTQTIDRALQESEAVLAVIGPGWLTATTPAGLPRLWQPDDYVRLELSRALQSAVPVIPVLVGEASLPAAADLPPELAPLVQRQGIELHDATWHEDVDGLVRALRGDRPAAARPDRRSRLVAGAVALALAVAGGALLWPDGGGDGESAADDRGGPSGDPTACAAPDDDGWTAIPLADNPTATVTFQGVRATFRVIDADWLPAREGKWQVTLRTTLEHDSPQDESHGFWLYDFLTVSRRPFPVTCFNASPDLVLPGLVGEAQVGFEVTCEPAGSMSLSLGERAATLDVTEAREPGPC